MNTIKSLLSIIALTLLLGSCGSSETNEGNAETKERGPRKSMVENKVDPMQNKGIGPIKSLTLGEINQDMVDQGLVIFDEKCSACHKADKKYIGPSPVGIMERRTPEWIMNMILNPEEMVKKDPIAKDLLKEYLSPMANQSLTEEEARAILEYFRTL